MNKFRFLAMILLQIIAWQTFAQMMTTPINIQSPNAAGLGKYGIIPVSYYTGTPNITIPIHTLNTEGISLPIYLQYDASGVRVNSHASWVGQNWSLNAGGVITRSVQWDVDECSISGFKWGYFNSYNQLSADGSNLSSLLGYDLEPDIFSFNFMGKTGRFFLGNDGQWKVFSDSNLDIIFDISDSTNGAIPPFGYIPEWSSFNRIFSPTIYGFRIRDDEGNIYEFGYNTNAIEYSLDFFKQLPALTDHIHPAQWIANAWYLTKVTNKYGRVIYTFNYQRDYFIADFYYSYTMQNVQNVYSSFFNIKVSSGSTSFNPTGSMGGNLISPVYLTSINSIDGTTVTFGRSNSWNIYMANNFAVQAGDLWNVYQNAIGNNGMGTYPLFYYTQKNTTGYTYNPNNLDYISDNPLAGLMWKKLDYISINNIGLSKYYSFTYNNNPQQHMFLTKLSLYNTTSSNGGTPLQGSYDFTYNNYAALPFQMSKAIDHWGYYNGSPYTEPTDTSGFANYFRQRSPNPSYMQYGILTSISYPTGGRTTFEYEPNTFSVVVPQSRWSETSQYNGTRTMAPASVNNYNSWDKYVYTGGGLRVKSITDFDGSNVSTRIFKYVSDYETNKNSIQSSGILARSPQYYWRNQVIPTYNESGSHTTNIFNIQSIVPLSNNFEAPVTYTKVIEEEPGNGYTVYNFSNYDTQACDDPANQPFTVYNSPYTKCGDRGFMRGKLLSQKKYDQAGNLVQQITNTYRTDNFASQYVLAANYMIYNIPTTGILYQTGVIYKMYYPKYDIQQQTQTDYLNGVANTTQINFGMKDYVIQCSTNRQANVRLLGSKTTTTSDNKTLTETYQYPMDNTALPYTSNLITAFRVAQPNQTSVSKNLIQTKYTQTVYQLNNNQVVPYQIVSRFGNAPNLNVDITFDQYDPYGNLLQYTAKGLTYSVIWGYNTTVPIGLAKNIQYNSLPSGTIQTLQQSTTSDDTRNSLFNQLRSQFPNSQINNYTYNNQDEINSITNQKGISESFLYDALGRLIQVKNHDLQITDNYAYHYYSQSAPQKYYNSEQSAVFTKSGCSAGYTPTQVTYTVPAAKYTSVISQADADQQALNDINSNGQAYANANGSCSPNMNNIYLTNNSGYNGYIFPMYIDGVLYDFPANGVSNSLVTSIPTGTHTFKFPCGPTSSFVMTPNSTPIPVSTCGTQFSLMVTSGITFSFYTVQSMSANLTTASTPPANFCTHGCSYTKTVYLANYTYYYDSEKTQPVKETLIFPYSNNPNNLIYVLNGSGVPTGLTFSCP
ncbi:DUF5977 domain-containing protein [Microbacter margulisiae]|uniref:DUF5977 domain-containing protein n=1 Tax=Microbacter margulisiae TaxID=1350067 RepID=A0A7W5DRN6_9PORP|nr:DUF5977 domain-containing protein [Microbacter margulisiae]MBB3187859.1 hypothetical protein [Microbacter margulisiae]